MELLPLVTIEDEDEIGQLLNCTCAVMSRAELSSTSVPAILAYLKKAIDTGLWKVRVSALQVLQVLVFGNLFTFTGLSLEITDLLLRLLEDSQIEVRELASSTLSGLAHCGFIQDIDKLKSLFLSYSRTKLPKRVKRSSTSVTQDPQYEGLLLKRHFGVLGLAALVEACPYSVPDWLPEVLDEIAVHIHDPAPIQASVKRAMSEFRRTHYDSWSEHKQKFTDDQLGVLADLLISPSYYA